MRNKKASNIPRKLVDRRAMSMPAVWCPECEEWLQTLTKVHVKNKHGLTQKGFLLKYPHLCDVFYWAEASTTKNKNKFSYYKKLAKKKGPSEERPKQ